LNDYAYSSKKKPPAENMAEISLLALQQRKKQKMLLKSLCFIRKKLKMWTDELKASHQGADFGSQGCLNQKLNYGKVATENSEKSVPRRESKGLL
jgi:hypothetical protein